MLTMAITDKGL